MTQIEITLEDGTKKVHIIEFLWKWNLNLAKGFIDEFKEKAVQLNVTGDDNDEIDYVTNELLPDYIAYKM
jgi:hypothetical protein